MDKKGFNSIEKAIDGQGEVRTALNEVSLEKDEERAFIEIDVFSPAGVLNGLHQANLLATHSNKHKPAKDDSPRLQLVYANEKSMTFFDVNSDNRLTMSMLRGE